ncbi:MAG: hypothetical protein IJ772_04595 [Bacilli bacterium]|nr:hypothetical protein [Bacilli bacterium]
MILANEKTIFVMREFGRTTNPRHTEKLKTFAFVAINGKYAKYPERVAVGDLICNVDKNPKQGFIELCANLKNSRCDIDFNGQKVKLDVLEDSLKFLNVEIIRKKVDGDIKKKYKFNDTSITASEFIARVDMLAKAGETVNLADLNGSDLVDYIISGKRNGSSEIEKKSAQWVKNVFYKGDFVFVRRVISYEIGGKKSTDTYWYLIGEDNSLAREENIVSQEFGILPFTSGSEVTEITPR